jgi:hypothetical protein
MQGFPLIMWDLRLWWRRRCCLWSCGLCRCASGKTFLFNILLWKNYSLLPVREPEMLGSIFSGVTYVCSRKLLVNEHYKTELNVPTPLHSKRISPNFYVELMSACNSCSLVQPFTFESTSYISHKICCNVLQFCNHALYSLTKLNSDDSRVLWTTSEST